MYGHRILKSYAVPIRTRKGETFKEVPLKKASFEVKFDIVKSRFCTTKEQILNDIMENESFKRLHRIARVPEPSEFFTNYGNLNFQFYEMVRDLVIFDELPVGWVYDQEITYKGAKLILQHIADIDVDEENRLCGFSLDAIYTLCELPSKLLSVSEYAELYKVGEGTVRQWIRRGKLRTAIKNGNQWLIPLLSFPPSRGYEGAQYKWDPPLSDLPDEYKYLNDFNLATFQQDECDKKKFYLYLVPNIDENGEQRHSVKMELGMQEREALELFMVSCREIEYASSF